HRAAEACDEADVDAADAELRVEPTHDVAARARELPLHLWARHACADRHGNPRAVDRDADHQPLALVSRLGWARAGRESRSECHEENDLLHGTLRNQSADTSPPARRKAAAPPAK